MIVQAEVGRSWPAWDDKHRYIWTHCELAVTDSIRGSESRIVVSEPGGSVDGVEQHFDGVLAWTPGEKVLVFLYRTPIGYLRTVGGPQGRFTVGADQRVHIDADQAELVSSRAGGQQKTPLHALAGMPLDRLRARLRALSRELPARR